MTVSDNGWHQDQGSRCRGCVVRARAQAGRGVWQDDHVPRANLAASTRTDVQGPRLAELRIDGDEVSGTDTVAMVKERILPALLGDQRAAPYVTFVFDNRVMHDDALFYADHPMLLPSWVQVLLSEAPFADFIAALGRLPK